MTEVRFEKNTCLFCYTFKTVMVYTNISALLTQTVLHHIVLFPLLAARCAALSAAQESRAV